MGLITLGARQTGNQSAGNSYAPFEENAVNGQAAFIVTFNVTHFRNAARRFGVRAIRPPEALAIWGRFES
jgi:hypothetical protein